MCRLWSCASESIDTDLGQDLTITSGVGVIPVMQLLMTFQKQSDGRVVKSIDHCLGLGELKDTVTCSGDIWWWDAYLSRPNSRQLSVVGFCHKLALLHRSCRYNSLCSDRDTAFNCPSNPDSGNPNLLLREKVIGSELKHQLACDMLQHTVLKRIHTSALLHRAQG